MGKLHLYTNSLFNELRQGQDKLADEAVISLIRKPELIQMINSWKILPDDLPLDFPSQLVHFFDFYKKRETSFDAITLERGQHFFEKNGDLYTAMLGFYSLPYCYAFGDGAEVLVRSKRIIDSIGERLGETGSFIMDIYQPGAFSREKSAFLVCAKVRLIHAFSRYFILNYAKDWNPAFGKPINQEDMLGTNLAFSQIVIRGLLKLGIAVTEEEHRDILAYWKWTGELMGIDVSFWPETAKEAFELDKLIRARHLRSSEAGKRLIAALLNFYRKTIPDPLLSEQAEGVVSFFLGKDASKALCLKSNKLIQGDLLGLFFKLNGFKNQGVKKNYSSLKKSFAKQQKSQFGKVLEIRLPEISRP